MRLALPGLLCLAALCLPRPALSRLPDGAFVRADGPRFVVQEPGAPPRPLGVVGANFDGLHGEQRDRHRQILRAMRADGFNLGRQWIVGEGPPSPSEWSRRYEHVRIGPDVFIDAAYNQLDRILAEAREQDIRIILTLSNHWGDYGGVPAYLRWAGLPDSGFAQEAFYTDPRPRAYFRAALDRLLLRTNTVTGVRYVDDPTIFAWELMNESSVLTAQGAEGRRAWIVEMARHIKARDPHHMVSAGLLGYASRKERAEWIRVHQLPEVDYCDSHLYLEAPPGPPAGAAAALQRIITDAIDDRAQLARFVIGKPLLIGEFGFRTDQGPLVSGRPRAAWFRDLLAQVLRDGAGALVWIYEPYSGKPRNYGVYTDVHDTDDVRGALRGLAPLIVLGSPPRNPRLQAARGAALLYDPLTRLRGPAAPHRAWQPGEGGARTLDIPPGAFSAAEFERAGVWEGGALAHAYGADAGFFEYRFASPPGAAPGAVVIEARLSSEWPGTSAPPGGGSEVRVLLDDVEAGRLRARPDDGLGWPERLRIEDPKLLQRLARGVHALRFVVEDGPGAHGLAIYGKETGKEPVPPGRYGPIRITYLP